MRFIHTADLHLGKQLLGHSLLEDQAHALADLERLCVDEGVDALLIAGDIFDRSVPPSDAVRLFSDFLDRLARAHQVQVVAISGNHDGADRLGFASELLRGAGVHLATRFSDRLRGIPMGEGDGAVRVYALPYLEPETCRLELRDDSVRGHDAAIRQALIGVHEDRLAHDGTPAVLIAHALCLHGAETQGSERPLAVGGAGHVGADAFAGFGYVALGHLHRPQQVAGRQNIRYAGSLLKYSIDEHDHTKSVALVDLKDGDPHVQTIVLRTRRDLVRLEGTVESLLNDPVLACHEGDYVAVGYTDPNYVLHAAEKLRQRFPLLLGATPSRLDKLSSPAVVAASRPDEPRALLQTFWQHVDPGHELEEAHLSLFEEKVAAAIRGATEDGDRG